MRVLVWLLRAFLFFALFAFALNNQQAAAVNWFFGYQWQAPMVIIVLAAFACGALLGVLAVLPRWLRGRQADGAATTTSGDARSAANGTLTPPAVNDLRPDGI